MPAALAVLMLLAADDVLERHQCFRCHAYETAVKHEPQLECAGCHRALSQGQLKAREKDFEPAVWARFVKRTGEHFVSVPPLTGLSRLRTSWLVRWLKAPHDLRPRLSESMIRNTLTDAELGALAGRFGTQADEPAPPAPSPARLAEAERQFVALGCAACHSTQKNAPDLAFARERMNYRAVVEYLNDPKQVNPTTEMPYGLHDDALARLLADYVYFGALPKPQAPAVELPAYDADAGVPTYDEVEARVFKKVCWHCHANPDFANGNGGPGMSGGFGYPARGLSFASFTEVMSGSRDAVGRAQSIFRPGPSGEPVLLEVLRARHQEERGQFGAVIGMPLGLPALSPEDFALVERWVKGGKRPPKTKRPVPGELKSPMLSR